jgi:hypothetical protein
MDGMVLAIANQMTYSAHEKDAVECSKPIKERLKAVQWRTWS